MNQQHTAPEPEAPAARHGRRGTPPMLHQAFEQARSRWPDRIAVEHGDRRLSYEALGERSDALAAALAERGFVREPVGICLERSPEAAVAVLGVLKAGAHCVTLDPSYPAERLEYMLEDSGTKLVLTEEALAARLGLAEHAAVWYGDRALEPGVPGVEVDLQDLSYVIYTSGSTGRPKGVGLPHRTLANMLQWQREWSTDVDRPPVLQFAPLSFDVSFQEITAAWGAGGTLVLVDEIERRDPDRLMDVIDRHRVRRIILPFVALQQMAEHSRTRGRRCPTLTEVVSTGEQLFITPAIRRFFTEHPGVVLENHYGPSETHLATALRFGGDPSEWPDRPGIGRPVTGVTARVLDESLRPVPDGAIGQLCLGGAGVARGYLGRPGLTAEKFVADPFGAAADRMYLTGDQARVLPDGGIEFVGRADDQVKIGGFRVELGEVTAAVKALAGVADAVVVVDRASTADGSHPVDRLIAYYVEAADGASDPLTLRKSLAERLPGHLVPSLLRPVAAFPLTPSGKVDKASLPRPGR